VLNWNSAFVGTNKDSDLFYIYFCIRPFVVVIRTVGTHKSVIDANPTCLRAALRACDHPVSLLLCPRVWPIYHTESLHTPRYIVATTVLRDTRKGTSVSPRISTLHPLRTKAVEENETYTACSILASTGGFQENCTKMTLCTHCLTCILNCTKMTLCTHCLTCILNYQHQYSDQTY
jgi:hypothetical protein